MRAELLVIMVCISICALCWSVAGLAFAWSQWKQSKSLVDDDEDGGGDQPPTPYAIDPQRDPGDWWKRETH
jgi:hypothetical protein